MAESRRLSTNPQTLSELQLYRVLERANLLPYYANFIHQGGDDVQQLCEAGEDEFLEIMSLVGMGSKPLHVRRLQKALQEWVANPPSFQEPLPAQGHHTQVSNMDIPLAVNLQPHSNLQSLHHPTRSWQQVGSTPATSSSPSHAATTSTTPNRSSSGSSQLATTPPSYRPAGTLPSPSPAAINSAPIGRTDNPVLPRETVENIRASAEQVIHSEGISPLPMNKKVTREVEFILSMSPDHPNRMEEIRKWASIYGRFDSKRKLEKPLTMHEVTVNEAAAQVCNLDPHLILQREKLFPLARQVVRDSGYQYRHGHSRSPKAKRPKGESKSKRAKVAAVEPELVPNPRTVQAEIMKIRREERMNEITTLLNSIKNQQYDLKAKIVIVKAEDNLQKVYDLQLELEKLTTQQLAYMTEQTDLIKKQKRSDRYYVAKAKMEGREDDEAPDGSLLPDDVASELVHDDQQQHQHQPHQQQQQPQTQNQQQQLQQHLTTQQGQPHPDRRSKCSSPLTKQEDHYVQAGNTMDTTHSQHQQQHYTPTSHNHNHDHGQHGSNQVADHPCNQLRQQGSTGIQQGRRTRNHHQGSPHNGHGRGSPRQQHQYSPVTTDQSHADSFQQQQQQQQGQVLQNPEGNELSHTGLPKRAAYKAQRQMMQHLLMDEGFRVAQTFGEYQPPQVHGFQENLNNGSTSNHGNHNSHGLASLLQAVTSQPQPLTLHQQ